MNIQFVLFSEKRKTLSFSRCVSFLKRETRCLGWSLNMIHTLSGVIETCQVFDIDQFHCHKKGVSGSLKSTSFGEMFKDSKANFS